MSDRKLVIGALAVLATAALLVGSSCPLRPKGSTNRRKTHSSHFPVIIEGLHGLFPDLYQGGWFFTISVDRDSGSNYRAGDDICKYIPRKGANKHKWTGRCLTAPMPSTAELVFRMHEQLTNDYTDLAKRRLADLVQDGQVKLDISPKSQGHNSFYIKFDIERTKYEGAHTPPDPAEGPTVLKEK